VWIFATIIVGIITGDSEYISNWSFGGFIGILATSLIVLVVSSSRNFDKYPIVFEDIKMPITQIGSPNQLKLLMSESEILNLFELNKEGGLNLFIKPLHVSVYGNELYVRKLTKRSPHSFFLFRDTKTRYYLVIPEKILSESGKE